MKFNVAFGKSNAFSLDIVPVTNRDYIASRMHDGLEVSEHDYLKSRSDPDGPHHNATFERAKQMCDGGTVVFA